MYLLIWNSYFIPSLPFPFGNHKFVFYVCEFISVLSISSFVLSHMKIPHVLSHDMCYHMTCVITWHVPYSVWFTPLSTMISRSLHVVSNGIISFFWGLSNTPPPFFCLWKDFSYWSGLPFPSPGDLSNPRTEPESLASLALQVDSLLSEPPGKPFSYVILW